MTLPRYELKYWCDDETWLGFLHELRGLVALDPHAAEDRPWYTISSLYLDTDDLAYFHSKMEGVSQRGKVRLRRYDRDPAGFVELKAKKGRQIRKHRVSLDASGLAAVARGDLEPLLAAFRGGSEAAARLLAEYHLRPLRPATITRYERSAYLMVDDPGVRVTLDRALACHGTELVSTFLHGEVDRLPMKRLDVANVLEVKFTGALPPPLGEPLRRLGLECRSISKYCLAILGAGQRAALPAARVEPQPEGSDV